MRKELENLHNKKYKSNLFNKKIKIKREKKTEEKALLVYNAM